MRRRVRVHLHPTADAGWEESKHPRDAGKFSSAPGRRGQSERSRGAVALARAIVTHKDDPKSGKSEYTRQREAELDDRRDKEYAERRASQEAKERQLAEAAKAKALGMSAQARKNRLAILETKLNHMSDGMPLRDKVAITREMRALKAADEATAANPSGDPEKAPAGDPEAPKGPRKQPPDVKKLRVSYQEALKVGNMAEARRLLREIKKAEEELEKGGSGK